MSDISVAELVLKLSEIKVKDMVQLVQELEEKWGVSVAPHIGVAAVYGSIEPRIGDEYLQERALHLVSYHQSKLPVIRVVRRLFDLGLKESKDLVESAPVILGQFRNEVARELAAELTALGAEVELR